MHILKLLPAPLILAAAAASAFEPQTYMARQIAFASRSAGETRESGVSISGCDVRMRSADRRREGEEIDAETLAFDLSRALLPAEADPDGAGFEIRFAPPYAPTAYVTTIDRTVASRVSSHVVRTAQDDPERAGRLLALLREYQARHCPAAG